MKAILVIDEMPNVCENCLLNIDGLCAGTREPIHSIDCPLKPVHSLKSGGKDYIIYERQFLYDNLDREIEMMKKGKEIYESNISNRFKRYYIKRVGY